jgi:CRISPR/Cas system-associated exonuclease Cas4 (RecB family)
MQIPTDLDAKTMLGIVLHDTLNVFYKRHRDWRSGLTGIAERPTKKMLTEIFEEIVSSKEILNTEKNSFVKAIGLEKLKGFYEKFYNEDDIPIYLEETFYFKLHNRSVAVKIDRIDAGTNGRVKIYDYKLGKVDAKDFKRKAQLILYKMAVEANKMEVESTSFIGLDEMVIVDSEITDKDIAKFSKKFVEFIDKADTKNFRATPNSFTCKWCSYKDVCEYSIL